MTHSPSLQGQREPVGVRTNGLGMRSIDHLNLTVSLADVDQRRLRYKMRKISAAERAEKSERLLRRAK